MAAVKANLDSGWANSTLTLVAIRDGVSLGTQSVTVSSVQGVTTGAATIDLSAAGAGVVELVIRDASGNVAWTDSREINASGAWVDNTSMQTLKSNAQIVRQWHTNKKVPTNNGDGTYDFAVRNDADDANVVVIKGYNPATGTVANPEGLSVVEETI